jgi:hypothetical protein
VKAKFRAATKHFMGKNSDGGVLIEAHHCIECLHSGRWQLFGDDKGVYKFATAKERDAKIKDILRIMGDDAMEVRR